MEEIIKTSWSNWLVVLACLVLLNVQLFSQTPRYAPGVVIVKVKPSVLRTHINSMTSENLQSDSLRLILNRFGLCNITKVFRDSKPADTLAFDLNQNIVKLHDLSGWLRFEFDQSVNLESIVRALSLLREIEIAGRDPIVEQTNTFPNELPPSDPVAQMQQWGLYNADARAPGASPGY